MLKKYKSFSPNASAGVEMLYNFKDYSVGFEAGYLVDLPGDLRDQDTESKLKDPDDAQTSLHSDWTGWRFGIKAIMWLRAMQQ